MEAWDAIRARRNVRQFSDRPLAADDLDRILDAGRRAPSGHNWQPWDFILVSDRETLRELATVWIGAGQVAGAQAAIVVASPEQEDADKDALLHFDVGQATMAMMIVAADLGIGTAHSLVEDQALARSLLGIPEDRFVSSLFSLGYPADKPLTPLMRMDRRSLADVLHRERW